MTGVKRTDDVLLAVRRLRGRGVSTPSSASSATGPTATAVERRAHELGIVRNCLFLGYQDEVAPVLRGVRRARPPLGERGHAGERDRGARGGRPVVATRVGGVPDVVRDGVDGFLVEPGDVEALAERLAEPCRRRRPAPPMGEAGRARVLERYAVSRLIDDVDALYRRLLAAK